MNNMSKIDDMALFVRVVKADGLAAAGRQLDLSPASMTARVNALERRYNVRLLNRTTRKISLTDAGQRFYHACLRVVAEVEGAEAALQNNEKNFSGPLRVTATSDFGRQFVAPALAQFAQQHPELRPYLHLTDGVVDLIENEFDLGVRYGNLPDSNLIVRPLADNHRILVAAPAYLKKHGEPAQPKDLEQHSCLVMNRLGEPLNKWQFETKDGTQTIKVTPRFVSNDGAIIRHWALAGVGIAYKSIWDVKQDLATGKLVSLLDSSVLGFQTRDNKKTGLQIVYPSRQYVPGKVSGFIEFLQHFLLGSEEKT